MNPRSVVCPKCKAGIGRSCKGRGRQGRFKVHPEREEAMKRNLQAIEDLFK